MLAVLPGLTPHKRQQVIGEKRDPLAAVDDVANGQVQDWTPKWSLAEWRDQTAKVTAEVARVGARWVSIDSGEYPSCLSEISDPPPVLYVRGRIPEATAVAVVGSRDCSRYGRGVAFRLGADLARCGLTVVSGLARGIDAAAHRGALEGGGKTVAVLPCGIDSVYPPRHRALAARVARQGALLTEFPPRTTTAPYHFPVRNRLIAGLAMVIVVVEAALRSGAGITARLALEAGREVLVVPGPVTSATSAGTNSLLSNGAHVCASWEDVLNHLQDETADAARAHYHRAVAQHPAIEGLREEERVCFAALPATGSCAFESLAATVSLPIPALLSALTSLEVRGLIRSLAGQRYERSAPGV